MYFAYIPRASAYNLSAAAVTAVVCAVADATHAVTAAAATALDVKSAPYFIR